MEARKAVIATIIIIGFTIIYAESQEASKELIIVEEKGYINSYFCPSHNCADEFERVIESASDVFCAFYDLKDKKIIEALKTSNARTIIYENNYEGFGESVKSAGLMHHKFCVVNNTHVITGSYNPTGENNNNRNNIMIIESKALAQNYEAEYKAILSGNEKKGTANKKIIHNGHELKNYFCPQDNCQEKIIRELEKAERTIKFLSFTFTDKEIAGKLAEKHEEGIIVEGIIENFQRKDIWVTPILRDAGIKVIISSEGDFQHNKVFIIDEKTVITGSYNPTIAAYTRNDENIVITRNPLITEKYVEEYTRIKESLT